MRSIRIGVAIALVAVMVPAASAQEEVILDALRAAEGSDGHQH